MEGRVLTTREGAVDVRHLEHSLLGWAATDCRAGAGEVLDKMNPTHVTKDTADFLKGPPLAKSGMMEASP